MGFIEDDTYPVPNNKLVFLQNGTDEALWTSMNWGWLWDVEVDLAFEATFVEPTRRILYWNSYILGTDYMGQALKNAASTHTLSVTTATDVTDFENKVALGGWDLVVLMIQDGVYDTPNFKSYVSWGGRAILADSSEDVPRGTLFGVTYTGIYDQDYVSITDGPLSAGVAYPMYLGNPGWSAFSRGMTASSFVAATFPNGDAAIVIGNDGRTIINGFAPDTPYSASDGLALFENEIMALLPFTVVSPNGGEAVPTGDIFNFRWIPSRAVSFNIDLSVDKGVTWKPLARQYADNSFKWRVPLQSNNKTKNLIKVTGFDEYGKKVGTDISNRVFTTEVVKLNVPNGGETWKSGSEHNIIWSTNNTLKDVASVKLYYTLNGGTTWTLIGSPLLANPGSQPWTVKNVTLDKQNCKVKVVLLASDGTKVGSDISDGKFTISATSSPPGIAGGNKRGNLFLTLQP